MPKDNNITNSDEQNAVTNQEAESHKNNIPGEDIKKSPSDVTASKEEKSKPAGKDLSDESVPNQANTGEPE
jgi:hypothetical protein